MNDSGITGTPDFFLVHSMTRVQYDSSAEHATYRPRYINSLPTYSLRLIIVLSKLHSIVQHCIPYSTSDPKHSGLFRVFIFLFYDSIEIRTTRPYHPVTMVPE
jgi:hypothetical protein